jgi:hypothetical protein
MQKVGHDRDGRTQIDSHVQPQWIMDIFEIEIPWFTLTSKPKFAINWFKTSNPINEY